MPIVTRAMLTSMDDSERYQLALRGTKSELEQVKAERDDVLLNHHSEFHGLPSTLITGAAAAFDGGVRGFFGAQANLMGVVPVTGLLGVIAAGAAVFIRDPSYKEALNAIARGISAPAISDMTLRGVTQWRNPALYAKMKDLDAAAAAFAAAPSATATKAAAAVAGV